MSRRVAAGAALVLALAAGCGSSSDVAESSPQAAADTPTTSSVSDPEELKTFEDWFRSDYVRTLDPVMLARRSGDFSHRPIFSRTFEDAADQAELVVAGQVDELIFIPTATITKFVVDATATGQSDIRELYFLQTGHVAAEDGDYSRRDNAVLVEDDVQPPLFKGDHAVLFLKDITGSAGTERDRFIKQELGEVRVYMIVRGAGQYRSANGTIRTEKPTEAMPTRE